MIWIICKDPGGTAGVLPIFYKLRELGKEVTLFANGKAVDLLPEIESDFKAYKSAEELLKDNLVLPEILVTSMCSKGGVGRDLVPMLRGLDIPTVALQDFWGSRLGTDWKDPQYWPECICVNDPVASKIVLKAWPDFSEERIQITGYPALDQYANYDPVQSRVKMRQKLGIVGNIPVILFAGQVQGTGDVIETVIEASNKLEDEISLIIREHPRMRDDAPKEITKWEKAIESFNNGSLVESSSFDTSLVLAAADVVLGAFSTVLVHAAVLQKEVIAVLFPDQGMAEFRRQGGGFRDEFPLVSLGCAVQAKDQKNLSEFLDKALNEGLGLEKNQEQTFCLDGKNAERVVQKVLECLNK